MMKNIEIEMGLSNSMLGNIHKLYDAGQGGRVATGGQWCEFSLRTHATHEKGGGDKSKFHWGVIMARG